MIATQTTITVTTTHQMPRTTQNGHGKSYHQRLDRRIRVPRTKRSIIGAQNMYNGASTVQTNAN
jgi:hypothetical protein